MTDVAAAARALNAVAYGYIGSWALLTASKLRLFDRLPAAAVDLVDEYPDPELTSTWLQVLAELGIVRQSAGVWSLEEPLDVLLVGDDSYADYLGGQIVDQMTPRILLGAPGVNELEAVLRDPGTRRGYEGWFTDADEAQRYQASQYAGSVLPGRGIARTVSPTGPVLDLGGGWGAVARAVAARHGVPVDVVDLHPVVDSAPPREGVRFLAGSALDPSTWPEAHYDGVILSYLLSSVPGSAHQPLLEQLAARGVRWVAVHDFMVGGGALAAAWSLQHAVFVPGHVSRWITDVEAMLLAAGFGEVTSAPLVDEMTTLAVGVREN